MVWAVGLIAGFAILQRAAGSHLPTPAGEAAFLDDLYMSGTTFFRKIAHAWLTRELRRH
jgi:hypothetical protein